MHKSQANRAVIAARVTVFVRPIGRPATDVRARLESFEHLGEVRRSRKATRMTGAQRNSVGQRSEWSRSPYYFTDPAWQWSVSTMPRGE